MKETTSYASVGGVVQVDSTQAVTVLGTRVTSEFADHIRRAAEAEDRSISWFLRQSARERMERMESPEQAAA